MNTDGPQIETGLSKGGAHPAAAIEDLPVARVEPAGQGGAGTPARTSSGFSRLLPWLVPILAAISVIVIVLQALTQRGPEITIRFADGNGLKAGDGLMYRGVRAGEVLAVTIDPDLKGVEVRARLTRDAQPLAREGTRFWIVRPEVSLTKVSGLETIVGPRYIETLPAGQTPGASGSGAFVGAFTGLETPPTELSAASPRGLALTLTTRQAGSLTPGSPVLYRGVRVGEVRALALSKSGSEVEVSVVVAPEHARLVRANSRWWNVSGFGLDIGLLGGLSLRTSSVETLVQGGVALATPDRPGPPAASGQVFTLASEAEKDWLEWAPDLSDAVAPKSPPSQTPASK